MDKEKIIVRAYVSYARVAKFDDRKFAAFVSEFPEVLKETSKQNLKRAIVQSAELFKDEVDPVIDVAGIKSQIDKPTGEVEYFFNTAPSRLASFLDHLKNFQFREGTSKPIIRKAVLMVYGADPMDPAGAAAGGLDAQLGDITGVPPETVPGTETAGPATPPIMDSNAAPALDATQQEGSLPADVEEQAVHTLNGFLQKDVFNNKIIPMVRVVEAAKLQNGYTVKFELASVDNTVKAYTDAVIYNDLLVLPAELRDEGNKVIGEFNKDTILGVFAEAEGAMPRDSDGYQNLMTQMISAPTEAKASAILERIIQRYGEHVGRNALDSMVRVKLNKTAQPKFAVADKLDVKLSQDAIEFEADDTYDKNDAIVDKIMARGGKKPDITPKEAK